MSVCVMVNKSGIKSSSITKDKLIIYPNPNSGIFTIQSTSQGKYSIINELGKAINTFELNDINNYNINVENLSQGVYFIVGICNNEIINQKVVVNKIEKHSIDW